MSEFVPMSALAEANAVFASMIKFLTHEQIRAGTTTEARALGELSRLREVLKANGCSRGSLDLVDTISRMIVGGPPPSTRGS